MQKVAVFYDWLNQWGGAERVLLDILQIYPEADLFTLVWDTSKTNWLPKNIKITTSFIDKLPFAKDNPIFYTFLYPIALEQFDFSGYDILISTTSTVGHCFLTPPSTLFICYFHNINRYLYQTPSKYKILSPILRSYQNIDKIYSQRPDYFFTNSTTVQSRIKQFYNRDSIVIHPGVNTRKFTCTNRTPSDFFLVVSRFVDHKKISIAIDACHKLGKNLIIVGSGRNYNQIKKYVNSLNNPAIKVLGFVSETRLIDLYQRCQALICPQIEDFGITPLEVQSCGRPVIAFNQGGITETVIDRKTGIFFNNQTVPSLVKAIIAFDKLRINPNVCSQQANKFSQNRFMLNFKQRIDNLWSSRQNITS